MDVENSIVPTPEGRALLVVRNAVQSIAWTPDRLPVMVDAAIIPDDVDARIVATMAISALCTLIEVGNVPTSTVRRAFNIMQEQLGGKQ